jgi:radical SAM protein with 4Fe4S-binding SPASM domain
MCPIQFRQDGPPHGLPAFMAWETFTRILDEMPDLEELHLQGLGEPMMHPRFFDMVEYAAARGIQVSTNSNLTLLAPWRAERCVASGLERAHVSIDGATAATYERIRVRSSLAKVLRNLDALLAARDRAGAVLPHLRMVTVVMRQNLHELPALVELAHRYRFEGVWVQHLCHDFGESSLPSHYRPMRDFVQAETLLGEDSARVARWFGEARIVAEQLGVELRLPSIEPTAFAPGTPGPARCDWPWHGAYVSYQGYAMPCCMIATPDRMNFGNVAERGLPAVWSSVAYEAFRDQLASDTPPEICRSCAVYTHTF